ncbi:histone-like nucleoid-structuring protein Lsr2 [Oerskovia enterophila]|uniref:histone-like nucleoid-structuring protein Lsr2 n=1 Tax=Oerskovia enterophila TaxID=43678 RepID=UPI0037F71773
MAQKVQVILVDDVDGGSADESVTFALDGVSYEIDLSSAHAEELREAFSKWVGHARKVTRGAARPATKKARSSAAGPSRATEIREWARNNGYTVSERGRISADIQQAFDAAN